ncbi:site-2 protease family protein [Spirillospora sp. NPDC046719]
MRQTLRLGTVMGIPVGVNWSVAAALVLVADVLARSILPASSPGVSGGIRWAAAVVTAVLFLASLAAHEFAHAVVARRFGVKVVSITLWMLGGVAQFEGEPPTARADLRIAAVGPAMSGALALAFGGAWALAGVAGAPATAVACLGWLAATNVLLAVFNLLPAAPLDGGRILRGFLWRSRGDRVSAAHTADRAGTVLGFVMIGGGLLALLAGAWLDGLWLALVGWFIVAAAKVEDRWTDLREAAAGRRIADVMTPHPAHGWTWQPAGAFAETVVQTSRQPVFPVVDAAGDPVGAVTTARLVRLRSEEAGTALARYMTRLDPDRVVGPEEPASAVLKATPMPGGLLAVVAADHRLVGIVTTEDLQRLVQRARFGDSRGTAA